MPLTPHGRRHPYPEQQLKKAGAVMLAAQTASTGPLGEAGMAWVHMPLVQAACAVAAALPEHGQAGHCTALHCQSMAGFSVAPQL